MEAIVLAGGRGTRLRTVVSDLPKPMAPVAGRPFLELLLRSLAAKEFSRVILSTGYMAEKISGYFGCCFAGIELDYSVESEPLGTGGAVSQAARLVREDHFFVFNGDTFLDLDARAVDAMWQRAREPVIVAREVEDTERYGRLEADQGHVVRFAEKDLAGPGLINAGCYVFHADQFAGVEPGARFSLETDFLAPLVERAAVALHVASGLFIDIGVPSDYARAQHLLAGLA
ncbi:D-glycero-alpha-D-manno-heptose 1-phosphate guanylyltransferase [Crenobacter luteus]|uniref:nucleotidyltransferase family protein n=1 Tax=Crenobacter luteus TaxID=1452487 RepID=UPI00104980E8|nr:nucleotidyltransferase family protein [Crenobacter luteus]TCP10548.1 D-glycero-alpha-D-manno-heptose 1-phosphate guanylyltransferase [Crenobacter luteus]